MSMVQNIETLPQQRGGNYEVARFNALRHGILSQHTVLPWRTVRSTGRCSKRSSPSISHGGRRRSTSRRVGRHNLAQAAPAPRGECRTSPRPQARL